ncbi:MAG: polysaccharide deacetylase family protein [Nitrospinae bacterium]|nr:polysaccharide deacetylase family protein [Nitrospinota bacterium]
MRDTGQRNKRQKTEDRRQKSEVRFSVLCPLFSVLCLLFSVLFLSGCAGVVPPQEKKLIHPKKAEEEKSPQPEVIVLKDKEKKSEDYVVIIASPSDTYESLSEKYYGSKNLFYIISEFNQNQPITPNKEIIVPLKSLNPGGLYHEGYLTIPILCYHQFGKTKGKDKMVVSEEMFDKQMAYLKENNYNVITLREFFDFVSYKRRPPKNSIVITIDDGWKNAKIIAAPILKKYGFKATLFVYTDLIKPSKITLTWDDIKEMLNDGVIEVQSHTRFHTDLSKTKDSESETAYNQRLEKEIGESQKIIEQKLGVRPTFLAYPFGTFNDTAIEILKKYQYEGAFTVIRGGNPFFYNNFSLNRSMVFNSEKIEDFIKLLETFKKEQL